MAIPYIGRRFRVDEFRKYLADVTFTDTFRPTFVTLHHTAAPTLAQRPQGFTEQHLLNLRSYYQDQLGWSGAPHLFIDDREDGIIVFQRLDRRGVHAVSFNRNSWGIEMLGYYDVEPFDKGRGAKVRDTAMQALALMNKRLGAAPESIKFHRDDPRTSKSCPGRLVQKADVISRVADLMKTAPPKDLVVAPGWQDWTVWLPGNQPFLPVHQRGGRPIGRVRQFLDAVAPGGSYRLVHDKTEVEWKGTDGKAVEISVAELDEMGTAWAYIRDLSDAAGKKLKITERIITIS